MTKNDDSVEANKAETAHQDVFQGGTTPTLNHTPLSVVHDPVNIYFGLQPR